MRAEAKRRPRSTAVRALLALAGSVALAAIVAATVVGCGCDDTEMTSSPDFNPFIRPDMSRGDMAMHED